MGRYKLIKSPDKMWELFVAYKESAKSKPILVQDFVGKDGQEVRRERERPLTMEGFENYCFENDIINDLGDYFSNKDNKYSKFSTICRAIRRMIREDQISGGMAGIYNPSITQRLNNLTESTQTKTEGIQKITIERINKDTNQ